MNHHISDTNSNPMPATNPFITMQGLDSEDKKYVVANLENGEIYTFDIGKRTTKIIETRNILPIKRVLLCIFIFLSFFASMDAKNKYTKNTDILLQKSMKNGISVADTEPILFISTLTILPNANIKEARGFLLTPEKVVWQVAGCVQFTEAVVLVSYEKDCTRYETLEGTYILWKGRKVLDYCPMESETFTRYALV
jgi:hypothetical protein